MGFSDVGPFGSEIPTPNHAADALNKEQIKDEAGLKPKAGDKIKVGDKGLVWQKNDVLYFMFGNVDQADLLAQHDLLDAFEFE